jgi:hypothetical protein
MNMKLTTTLPLLVLLCFGLVGQTVAQTRVPGVQAGDHFTYTVSTSWSSDNLTARVPTILLEMNNTLWYKVSVSGVSCSNVTTTDVWHFVNGTEVPSLVVQDVDSGSMYYMTGFGGIVGANLGVNDLLHPSGDDLLWVNQTISRNYASGKRDTNVVMGSYPLEDSTNNTIGTENVAYYFDKATGVLVELRDAMEYVNPKENGSVIWMLRDTNLWTVSAFSLTLPLPMPILLAIIAVIIVAIASVIFYRKRRNHKKKFRR